MQNHLYIFVFVEQETLRVFCMYQYDTIKNVNCKKQLTVACFFLIQLYIVILEFIMVPIWSFFPPQNEKKKLVLDLIKYKYEVIHSLNVIQFDYLINCSTKV